MKDLEFKTKLDKIREDYKKNMHLGSIAKSLARARVRTLCNEYGKDFDTVWHE